MHIPDGFLATPVWATLDVAAAPAVGYLARRAQQGLEQSKVPLVFNLMTVGMLALATVLPGK